MASSSAILFPWHPRSQNRRHSLSTFRGMSLQCFGIKLSDHLWQLLNKVAGVYGLISLLTGAGASAAQLSLYIYSTLGLAALAWGLRAISQVRICFNLDSETYLMSFRRIPSSHSILHISSLQTMSSLRFGLSSSQCFGGSIPHMMGGGSSILLRKKSCRDSAAYPST